MKFKRKEYKYYIVYAVEGGFVGCTITRDCKIKTYEDIDEIIATIEDVGDMENVVIINYRRIK